MTNIPYAGTGIASHDAWDMGHHHHPELEMSVVLEGQGRFQCGEIDLDIGKGDIVLIPPDLPHRYYAHSSIRFAVLMAGYMPKSFVASFMEKTGGSKHAKILHFSPIHLEHYEALFRIWLRMVSEQDADLSKLIPAWGELLLLTINQYARSGGSAISVAAAADYIRSHLTGEIRIQELARMCGLSDSSFRRKFHSAYGCSPKQYQQESRMGEAKWLLRASLTTIQDIALQVGFASVHAFSAWFQQKEGVPPTEWRRIQQSTTSSHEID